MSFFDYRFKNHNITAGDILILGNYMQDDLSKKSPIKWRVLFTDSNEAVLISEDSLLCSGYYDIKKYSEYKEEQMKWKNSLAKEECSRFYEDAFSNYEKSMLIPICIETDEENYVFLLSQSQVEEYLPIAQDRKAKPSLYALNGGARVGWTPDTKKYTSWWILPEQCFDAPFPKAVFQNGEIQFHSRNICHSDFTIRPCIRIDINKYIKRLS